MIKIDNILFDVGITDLNLDVEFFYKCKEKLSDFSIYSELGAVFYNQEITFEISEKAEDFSNLFKKLSEATDYHLVEIFTPLGKMNFNMYPSQVKLKLLKSNEHSSLWSGMTVKFSACNPVKITK